VLKFLENFIIRHRSTIFYGEFKEVFFEGFHMKKLVSVLVTLFFVACNENPTSGENPGGVESSESKLSSIEASSSSSIAMSSSGEPVNYSFVTDPANCSPIDVDLPDDEFCDARDGEIYKTTVIGTQTWMAENLNFDAGANSYCYDDDPTMCSKFGRLYTWQLAMTGKASSEIRPSGVQGICSEGWHLPSESEWETLAEYVDENSGSQWGDDQGNYLKSTSGWDYRNGTDDFGFTGLAGGARFSATSYRGHTFHAYFWSTTDGEETTDAQGVTLLHDYSKFEATSYKKSYAYSVRCLKD
jgi:uncharacterized protein (TIGR02145 family)